MKVFKNDDEKLQFMLPILARYRIFIMSYLNITRTDVLNYISIKSNKPVEECHFNKLSLEDSYTTIEILKCWKQELTGTRKLPVKGNMRKYAYNLKHNKDS